MRKGTFSVQKTHSNSAAHNSREQAPKYLIGLEKNTQNYYELIQKDDDFILQAQQIYKDKIGQKMQKKQIPNLIQETVLTLKKNQDENDVKKLFKKLHEKFGGHELLEVSVHRDEGYFEKNGIAYYLTKNIIKKNNEYFIKSTPDAKEFDKKININDFTKVYNYHAHAKFSMFDKSLGKTARMQKKDMSNRIKFVSEELGLEFAPEKKTSRIKKAVHQIKDEHYTKAKVQEKLQYNFREYQKRITALQEIDKEQKKQLHKLNSQVKNNKATIEKLESFINELQAQNKQKDEQILKLKEKINSTQDMSDLKAYTERELNIKIKKTPTISQYFNFFIKKIKDLSSKITNLVTENRELQEKNSDLKIKIINLETDIEVNSADEVDQSDWDKLAKLANDEENEEYNLRKMR